MENRRSHHRYEISLSCEIVTDTDPDTDTIYAKAKNLSVGGLGVACEFDLAVKTRVVVSLFLVEDGIEDAGTEPLTLSGEVVWCTPDNEAEGHLAGLRFLDITEAQKQAVNQILVRLAGE